MIVKQFNQFHVSGGVAVAAPQAFGMLSYNICSRVPWESWHFSADLCTT